MTVTEDDLNQFSQNDRIVATVSDDAKCEEIFRGATFRGKVLSIGHEFVDGTPGGDHLRLTMMAETAIVRKFMVGPGSEGQRILVNPILRFDADMLSEVRAP